MQFAKALLLASNLAYLTGCGSNSPQNSLSSVNERSRLQTVHQAASYSDSPIIKEKLAKFRANSKNNAICGYNVNIDECIQALDKLIALSTTSLFPTNLFEMIDIKRKFENVGTDGWLDIDFSKNTDEIKNHLAKQPDFLPVLRNKIAMFRANSKNNAICGWDVTAEECLSALDKLLTLSTTSLFPTDLFDMIDIKRKFENVGTDGWLNIDFSASVDAIKKHLSTQPGFLPILRNKIATFRANSKNNAICGWNVNPDECMAALDKLLVLSTTSLFPTDHFDMIDIKREFKNVGTDGWVDINFVATVDEIKGHLAAQ